MLWRNPHSQFGLHGQTIILWRPGAEIIHLEVLGQIQRAKRLDASGIFIYESPEKIDAKQYRVYHNNGLLAYDPYAFSPEIEEKDLALFKEGKQYNLYRILGANFITYQGIQGVRFVVWAPHAQAVCLIADFNHFDGRVNPMRSVEGFGLWELFVPGLLEGEKYKFEIHTQEGYVRIKSDPVAFYAERRPKNASVVADVYAFQWHDQHWMGERKKETLNRCIQIYEVHLGSWRRYDSFFPNYRVLARDLAQYCQEMHFTHVELLPIMEHPLDASWGYQVTGFFAVTSRYGTVEDFQFFVDYLHQKGIGVILDWVPAHFPTDDYALNRFDGTSLYEHDDPRRGIHPHWQTAIFNYGTAEVSNFLLASALFWLDVMHVDGLRVDAVASMLYLDYGRKEGEWIPNPDGSNHNYEAITFLKHLNSVVHARHKDVLMIAEESSSYVGVTQPVEKGGLGFDLKWNMGWMNDTLCYFSTDVLYRKFHQNELTFSMLYAFSEQFLTALSHDEVVHGKDSLLSKMPGPDRQKFANARLLYSYMMCHPGKKLLFMGDELGQWGEWDCQGQIDWFLLQYPLHEGLHRLVRDLNRFAQQHPALWEKDFGWEGYEWIDFSDADRSIISYMRKSSKECLVCVHHFAADVYYDYPIPLSKVKQMKEVLNTDALIYGGSNHINSTVVLKPNAFYVTIAPFATQIFEVKL